MDKKLSRWEPGESGNPKGRPKSSRNVLTDKVIKDISRHWKTNGVKALDLMLEKDPSSYVRAVTSLVPKDVQIQNDINVNFIDAIKEIEDRARLEAEVAIVEIRPSEVREGSFSDKPARLATGSSKLDSKKRAS